MYQLIAAMQESQKQIALRLPQDASKIALATSDLEVENALRAADVVVLAPNKARWWLD